MQLDISTEATILAINKKLSEIIARRDEKALVNYVRELTPEWDTTIIGILRAYYQRKMDSFEWAMYVFCRYKGFEDLVARFFIGNWQVKMRINC